MEATIIKKHCMEKVIGINPKNGNKCLGHSESVQVNMVIM